MTDLDPFTLPECRLCQGGRGHDGMPVCEASCPSLTEPDAIVRELAERPPVYVNDLTDVTVCVSCGINHPWSNDAAWLAWLDPANHLESCLWRRARALYPKER